MKTLRQLINENSNDAGFIATNSGVKYIFNFDRPARAAGAINENDLGQTAAIMMNVAEGQDLERREMQAFSDSESSWELYTLPHPDIYFRDGSLNPGANVEHPEHPNYVAP